MNRIDRDTDTHHTLKKQNPIRSKMNVKILIKRWCSWYACRMCRKKKYKNVCIEMKTTFWRAARTCLRISYRILWIFIAITYSQVIISTIDTDTDNDIEVNIRIIYLIKLFCIKFEGEEENDRIPYICARARVCVNEWIVAAWNACDCKRERVNTWCR